MSDRQDETFPDGIPDHAWLGVLFPPIHRFCVRLEWTLGGSSRPSSWTTQPPVYCDPFGRCKTKPLSGCWAKCMTRCIQTRRALSVGRCDNSDG